MILSCVVIDDEPKAISILQDYIEKTASLDFQKSFRNPVEAIEYLNLNQTDLIFLDINMPLINGIQLIDLLLQKPLIVFTTAYSEFAVKSYELNTVDYLMKPIQFDRFLKAVTKVIKIYNNNHQIQKPAADHIYLKSGVEIHRVQIAEIHFLEKDKHYIIVHIQNKKIIVRMTFNAFLQLIPQHQFIQIHKSFVIALRFLESVDSNHAIVNGKKIPIGRHYREFFLKKIQS